MRETNKPPAEQPGSERDKSEIIGVSLSEIKERTPEERKQLRETIGAEAAKKYLDVQPDDDDATRKLKAGIAGQDLEGTIGQLLDAGTEAERRAIMEQLGISKSEVKQRDGKTVDRWRLRNPDDEVRGKIPGSFANPEHLKAFIAGFAAAKNLMEQQKVIFDVYRYLGFDTLNADDLMPVEEEAAQAEPVPRSRRTERPFGEARPAGGEPVPLSQWKPFMTRLARFGRAATLATGLITLFALRGDHGPTRAEAAPEPAKIEYVEKASDQGGEAEFKGEKEKAVHALAAGETVDGVVRGMLADSGLDEQAQKDLVKKVLAENDIADQWYKTQGSFDSTKLPVGTVIDVTVVNQRIREIRQIDDLKAGLELGH